MSKMLEKLKHVVHELAMTGLTLLIVGSVYIALYNLYFTLS